MGRLLQRNFPTSSTLPIVILSGRTKSFLLSMSTMTFNFTICTFQTFKKLVQFYHKPHSLTFLGPKQDIVCLSNQNMYYFYMSMVVRLDLFGIRVSVYGACIWLWLWHYRFNSQLGLLTPSSSCPYSGQDRSSILRELFFNNDVRGIIDLILAPEDERAN